MSGKAPNVKKSNKAQLEELRRKNERLQRKVAKKRELENKARDEKRAELRKQNMELKRTILKKNIQHTRSIFEDQMKEKRVQFDKTIANVGRRVPPPELPKKKPERPGREADPLRTMLIKLKYGFEPVKKDLVELGRGELGPVFALRYNKNNYIVRESLNIKRIEREARCLQRLAQVEGIPSQHKIELVSNWDEAGTGYLVTKNQGEIRAVSQKGGALKARDKWTLLDGQKRLVEMVLQVVCLLGVLQKNNYRHCDARITNIVCRPNEKKELVRFDVTREHRFSFAPKYFYFPINYGLCNEENCNDVKRFVESCLAELSYGETEFTRDLKSARKSLDDVLRLRYFDEFRVPSSRGSTASSSHSYQSW